MCVGARYLDLDTLAHETQEKAEVPEDDADPFTRHQRRLAEPGRVSEVAWVKELTRCHP